MPNYLDELRSIFGDYRSSSFDAAWAEAKKSHPVGSTVSGTVAAKTGFGVFVDIGVGVPAMLEITRIRDMTPELRRSGQWCPLGSRITARVVALMDNRRLIGLSQLDPDPYLKASR